MTDKKPRGLGSLIASTGSPAGSHAAASQTQLLDIPIDDVLPSPRQPRRTFGKEGLESLAQSIRQHGLLQPVVVRPMGDKFELIAGERRWRATKLAGSTTISAVSKPADNAQSLTLSIIENLQREDLDPVEEATAFQTLINDLNLTQEQVAVHVGKDRSTITNALRLLELPLAIQAKLSSGALTPGHARVLLAVPDPVLQSGLAERAADKKLSVRELELLVYGQRRITGPSSRFERPAHVRDIENRLAARLGVRVRLREGRHGGKLVIEFGSNEDFLRILEALGLDTTEV